MSRNRRKNNDSVRVAAFAWWLVVFIALSGLGLSYVSIKNQTLNFADQRGKLEKQLRSLNDRNRALNSEATALGSRSALQKQVATGFIQLVEIDPLLVVRIGSPSNSTMVADAELPEIVLARK